MDVDSFGVPHGQSISASHPHTAYIKVTNSGTGPEAYFVDGRMNSLTQYSLPSITSPMLVIAGEQDLATPPEHGRLIADAVPGARVRTVAQAAHLASVERSAEVTRLIVDHLEQQEDR